MKKGEILKNQDFERYFMGGVEKVDAEVLDFMGEYFVIVKIGTEKHRVDFSLGGIMRSREILA
jgi:hypothetical protein